MKGVRDIRDHDGSKTQSSIGVVVIERWELVEWILRMRMRVVLSPALRTCLCSGLVCGGKDILGPITERSTADPIDCREPGDGDPDEKHHVDPEQRETLRGADERGYGGAGHRLAGNIVTGEGNMYGEEYEQRGEGLEDSEPETAAKEADVERRVDAPELVETVFRERPGLLDPSERPSARQGGRGSPGGIVR